MNDTNEIIKTTIVEALTPLLSLGIGTTPMTEILTEGRDFHY